VKGFKAPDGISAPLRYRFLTKDLGWARKRGGAAGKRRSAWIWQNCNSPKGLSRKLPPAGADRFTATLL